MSLNYKAGFIYQPQSRHSCIVVVYVARTLQDVATPVSDPPKIHYF